MFFQGISYGSSCYFYYHYSLISIDLFAAATNGRMQFLATPNMKDPSAWQNHFYSSDDLLNKIWYGCGYTTQVIFPFFSTEARVTTGTA